MYYVFETLKLDVLKCGMERRMRMLCPISENNKKQQQIISSTSPSSFFSSASLNVDKDNEPITDVHKSHSFSSGYLRDKNRHSVEAKCSIVDVTTQLPTSTETLMLYSALNNEPTSPVPVSLMAHDGVFTSTTDYASVTQPVIGIDDVPRVKINSKISSTTTTPSEDVNAALNVNISATTPVYCYGLSRGYLRDKELRAQQHLSDDTSPSHPSSLSQSTASSVQLHHTETTNTIPFSETVEDAILLPQHDITSIVPKVSSTSTYGLSSGYIREKASHQLYTSPSNAIPIDVISNIQLLSSLSSPSFISDNKNISLLGNDVAPVVVSSTCETSINIDTITTNNNLDLKSMIQQHLNHHSSSLTHSLSRAVFNNTDCISIISDHVILYFNMSFIVQALSFSFSSVVCKINLLFNLFKDSYIISSDVNSC